MAMLKREYGGIQPCWKVGLFRIRLPFIHFKISPPEVVTGLMNACTSYGALAVLITTLGLDPAVAWALVVFETMMYTLNWLLGEPSICGWITPAMAIIVVFLESLDPGVARLQMLTAIQLELGILFIILGATGLSKKLNTMVPPAIKAGIVMGAGVNAVAVRLKTGGAIDTVTVGCLCGLVVVFMLMFSKRVRKYMDTNKFVAILGNYSFLWAVIALLIAGGVAGEFNFQWSGEIIKVPDFMGLFAVVSPLFIGFASDPGVWIAALPYAIVAWVIAYGDFVTVQQLGLQAARDDEYIEFDPNRTNVICGIRNVILSLFAPDPALAGPLSAPYCVATYARYKQSGRQGMDSIYDGSGTNLLFTVLGSFVYPLYEASLAASEHPRSCTAHPGWLCSQIAFGLVRDDLDKGMTGMIAGFIVARGGGVGFLAAIVLYLLISDNDKIRADYAYNKELQRIEDEDAAPVGCTPCSLEAAKAGKLQDEEK